MVRDGDIAVQDLLSLLERGEDVVLLDVREPEEYAFVHLDATLIPLGQLAVRHGELDRSREIVVYCHHGIRSRHAVELLKRAGFPRVRNLEGGIDAWSRLVDPGLPRY